MTNRIRKYKLTDCNQLFSKEQLDKDQDYLTQNYN
jgi:hypothetical protein